MASIEIVDGFVFVFGTLSFLMNAASLVTLLCNNFEEIFRRSMCYMVACLAVADLLTGVNSVLWALRHEVTGFYLTDVLFTIYWITVQVSFLTILAMAIDRFISVTYPAHSKQMVSPRRTLVGCSLIWIVSILIGILFYYKRNVGIFVFCVLFEVNIIAVAVMYALIYRKARAISKVAHSGDVKDKHTVRKANLEARLYVVVLVLVGMLVITVLPYILAVHIHLGYFITSGQSSAALSNFINFYFPVELINFALNPIVYAWRLPKYRKALWRTFTCRC